jgi:hypothetical protein
MIVDPRDKSLPYALTTARLETNKKLERDTNTYSHFTICWLFEKGNSRLFDFFSKIMGVEVKVKEEVQAQWRERPRTISRREASKNLHP